MRIEYEDDELRRLATGEIRNLKRWPTTVTKLFHRRIATIAAATDERDLRELRALHLEQLKGPQRSGQSSIRLDRQYRLILRFYTDDHGRVTVIIDGLNYHKG
ncbi:type II toxin-antitoxin system RelE/ParE family toxin [Gephyromycinifex aptenodytis]|uniref:type II toxin-antitoxin system RelE/ParE family toxin n=1 Tax=Gephyromycinifex aptenodytis TaxID=2716227 RepID=UPI001447E422|nr:type II toxin-antitoxin system RelE/ParE family toxin [Gephyromycinifex aptenodytis]